MFGSLVAAGIPLLLALTALTAAIGVLTVVSHWLPVGSSTFEVVVIIGMAVGVDYSLFYLRREREERASGPVVPGGAADRGAHLGPHHRGVRPDRDGRAWRGCSSSAAAPFNGIALGTIAVVGIAVAGSLTVLPALLAWLGPKRGRRAGSRSSAAGGPPPGRPGCGRRWPAGWSPAR